MEEDGGGGGGVARPFTATVRDNSPRPTCQLLLSMVDEAVSMIKALTYISDKTLDKIELSREVLDPDTFNVIQDIKLCSAAYQAASGLDIRIKERELSAATWRACKRFMEKAEDLKEFFASREEQAQSLLFFSSIMEEFRRLVLKRLTTTLEDENAISAYLDEVFRREDRAVKDHTTLSQQLKTEQDDRSRAYDAFKLAERTYQEEAQTEKSNFLALQRQRQQEFDGMESEESRVFEHRKKKLSEECEQLVSSLDRMQEENRILELTARGKKEQSVEEVANMLVEYEADIAKKKDELDRLAVQHQGVDEKMNFYKGYYEKRAREEKQREEEANVEARANFKLKRSATLIQRRWRVYLKKKKIEEAARKKREKAAAKKKKK